jgi:hypothetical protein
LGGIQFSAVQFGAVRPREKTARMTTWASNKAGISRPDAITAGLCPPAQQQVLN